MKLTGRKVVHKRKDEILLLSGVLALNATTDVYLSFNNATVTIVLYKNAKWVMITRVNVYDVYDLMWKNLKNINSFKTVVLRCS